MAHASKPSTREAGTLGWHKFEFISVYMVSSRAALATGRDRCITSTPQKETVSVKFAL